MKKTLALIFACCLVFTGCKSAPERYEDPNSEKSYGSSNEVPDSSDNESSLEAGENSSVSGMQGSISSPSESKDDQQSSLTSSTSSSSAEPQSSSISSSSSSSIKPQSSSASSSSSSSKKPQSSSTNPSSKPQSSSSVASSAPPSVEIIGNYGRRAQEAWEIEFADEVFRLVNVERVKYGLPEFKKMQQLTESATVRAWECLVNYGHDRPDGQSYSTALTEQGIKFKARGENIAAGQKTPQQVVDAWMNSPGHRENILSEHFEYLGVGFYYDKDGIGGAYRYYWAQNFCSLL